MIKDLFSGIDLFRRGCREFYGNGKNLRLCAIPFAINLLIYILGIYLFFIYALPFISSWLPQGTEGSYLKYLFTALRYLLYVAAFLAVLTIYAVTFNGVLLMISSPFFDLMSQRMEKSVYKLNIEKLSGFGEIKYFFRAFCNSARLAVVTVAVSILLFPLSLFVPYLGFIIAAPFIAYLSGYSFLLYSAEHRYQSRHQTRAAVKGKRAMVTGLGLCVYLLSLVPFGALFCTAPAVLAGTILFNEKLEK